MALRASLGVLGLLGLLSCSRASAGLANAPSLGGTPPSQPRTAPTTGQAQMQP
jgi:hypothetical protein